MTARGAVMQNLAFPQALGEMLTQLRAAHVRYLPGLVSRLRTQVADVLPEGLVEVNDGRVFGGLQRFDAIATGPKVHDLQVAVLPNVQHGMSVDVNGTPCAVIRFPWNECRVQARVDDDRWHYALNAWLTTWLDPEDKNPTDMLGLSSVVHSVRDVAVADGMLSFTVDFGSAPIECVGELIGALVHAGASFVAIGESETLSRASA
ncbi:MAG TPA: hypothetical protein VGM90_09670 [Kofleriaceae bacterium]